MWIIGGINMYTDIVDITGMVDEVPVCAICGMPILISEEFVVAQAESAIFLIHYECSDVEFYHT